MHLKSDKQRLQTRGWHPVNKWAKNDDFGFCIFVYKLKHFLMSVYCLIMTDCENKLLTNGFL